ncbi:Argininosuccinate synthase [Colletotrichum higginsianum]|uniref:argininosuccinate synthase n=1 Tax=Colletotrichum higginsianum TaxID=80884 RepID=A0A4T0VJ90_9PEZI|nr:Argininosuccinate synthase [Colletotrichum higginsianum]
MINPGLQGNAQCVLLVSAGRLPGCTGWLAFDTINPSIKVLAPWRLPEFYQRFQGRNDLIDYAAEKGIPVTSTKAKPYSMDDNFTHCSYEAGMLEDMWANTVSPLKAPDVPLDITIHFEKGLPVKVITPEQTSFDEPTSTSRVLFWMLEFASFVNDEIRLHLYKGSVYVLGRISEEKLNSEEDASMDSLTNFDSSETSGFITIYALRLKKASTYRTEAGIKF